MTESPIGLPYAPNGAQQRDAAPDSLLSQLRAEAARKREAQTVCVELPEYGGYRLRATYVALGMEELERYFSGVNPSAISVTSNLDICARSCRSIEAYDESEDQWLVLEDEIGPVTFDDRLTRLLQWPRPGDEFRYSAVDVYEGMFSGNGFAVMTHAANVLRSLGLIEEEISGESTSASPTRSAMPPRSA